MNIQRENSAHHFRMQSEREQTLVLNSLLSLFFMFPREGSWLNTHTLLQSHVAIKEHIPVFVSTCTCVKLASTYLAGSEYLTIKIATFLGGYFLLSDQSVYI